jgi:DNA (cytosine-5)-methyltransferase 1
LTQTFVEIANEMNPTVVVWENVKGVLSDGNNAFGEMLGGLAGCGQAVVAPDGRWKNAGCVVGPKRNIAWRVLDAKHGGVPQQRRRVFLVGCPSSGPNPAEILFEPKAVRRNFAEGDSVQPRNSATAPVYFNCDSRPKFSIEYAHPLKADKGSGGRGCVLAANDNPRRLTPLECERLMGFPDGWTDLPGARDSERWSSLGNAVAVTDARWIGQRIKEALRKAA